jgi:hypothetical protein
MGILEINKAELEGDIENAQKRITILDSEIRERETEQANLRAELIKVQNNLAFLNEN